MGIDPESLRTLLINDFSIIDLGGSGGTNFAQIENERRKTQKLNFLEDIGLSTVKISLGFGGVLFLFENKRLKEYSLIKNLKV